jgi:acyl-coenzyme A thioesterase PaaI-like protein
MGLRGGPHFAGLVHQVRRLQDGFTGANLPLDVAKDALDRLTVIADTMAAHQVDPLEAPAGARLDLPGRGHPFLPPHVIEEWTDARVRAQVTFTRLHLGGNGAASGGAHAVLFNEILGRLSAGGGRPLSRTAYIHVNYRSVTPIGRQLTVDATLDRVDGRKRYVTGRLCSGTDVVADAEGLFVELLPGQP